MEAALARAGVAPAEVDYLEAHGNGSVMGDPIEVQAAAAVYGRGRAPDRTLLMGSVKTNVGHLETAAGVAALIKTALAMNRGVIPRHLHFENPTPVVDWDRLPVRVTAEATEWPAHPGRPARAAVSAFGVSGANAHAVVEGYGAPDGTPVGRGVPVALSEARAGGEPLAATDAPAPRGTRLLPLSAKSDAALGALARTCLDWLDERMAELTSGNAADPLLADLAWTAAVGRSHFDVPRGGRVPGRRSRCATALDRTRWAGRRPEGAEPAAPADVQEGGVRVFGGEGRPLGPAATEELYGSEPAFSAPSWIAVTACVPGRTESFAAGCDVRRGGFAVARISRNWSDPALYAVQCGLTALWSSIGIAAAGHDRDTTPARTRRGPGGRNPRIWKTVCDGPSGGEAPPGDGSANPELPGGTEIVMEIGPGTAGGFAAAVAAAYEAGLEIHFEGLFAGETRRRIALPGYPFERRRYWIPSPNARA